MEKLAKIAAVFLFGIPLLAIAEGTCRKPVAEYWHTPEGRPYLAAVVHAPCEWRITGAAGARIEAIGAAGNAWLLFKWSDAARAGIVEEKVKRKKFSKKCEPEFGFEIKEGRFTGGVLSSYPCGDPGGYVEKSGPAVPFGSQGFDFSSPDPTGHVKLRDKATGRTLDCYNGSCS